MPEVTGNGVAERSVAEYMARRSFDGILKKTSVSYVYTCVHVSQTILTLQRVPLGKKIQN